MQIFVSSTCFDLIDLRAELKIFLNNNGLTPIMSDELETDFVVPENTNSIETCLVNLRKSDIVILILSQRYGPSLEKAGFPAISATHLEYEEAIKNNKHLIVFVRDRLEADYNTFKKTNDPKTLSWVKDKDIKIFEIIEKHKKLSNSSNNNWYWTFQNSVEIKKRLSIDLKKDISAVRLNDLIAGGAVPLIIVNPDLDYTLHRNDIILKFTLENLGSQPAIEPSVIVYEKSFYQEVIDNTDEGTDNSEYDSFSIDTLKSNETSKKFEILFPLDETRAAKINHTFFVEILYMNQFGDILSDISEINVYINDDEYQTLSYIKSYVAKRYRGKDFYQKIIKN